MARLLIAKILNAHGIRGLVKLRSYVDDLSLLEDESVPLYKDQTGSETITVTLKNPVKGDYLAAIEGVNDRNGAEALRHQEIYMEDQQLPELGDDEIYHKDLVGLSVIREDGGEIGIIGSVDNFGAEDLLNIKRKGQNSFFLPFRNEFVVNINLEDKKIILKDFEDYLD